MNDRYYNMFKPGLASLIPEGPNAIMDLGCGTGLFGRKLKELNKAREVVGVEIFKDAADEAAKHYEKVYHGDVEQMILDYEDYFDFIVCSDIVEHLVDPWKMLQNIHTWLRGGGHIIVSIPNVRYWRVLRNLILRGDWEYLEGGILDKTHLRFFTEKSFLKALTEAGFSAAHCQFDIGGMKQKFANTITLGLFEEFMGSQIFIVGKKAVRTVETMRPPIL